ncbi:DUF2268 domain-containing putative Zn-dependent protease [Vibrio sp. WXL103]|uniref:DUF2268 domain-containing putative Zn-dependent protease n=1 Tax=Vibrio sp. WXL103 TaxID=3450710 RepID=UPI003EC79395
MSVKYEISEQVHALKEPIMKEISQCGAAFGSFFDTLDTTVKVTLFKQGKPISPSGIGGYAFSKQDVEIYIDDARKDIIEIIERDLRLVIGHELNHALRFKSLCRGLTLGETVIDEGLACYFEYLLANKQTPEFLTLSSDAWKTLLEKMRSSWNSSNFSYPLFYFGEYSDFLPRYASYIVGFNLVKNYIESNNIQLIDAMSLKSEVFTQDL